MGILSTLLTIGGTIAGSFVGAPGIGASIGGAIGGALDQSSASSSASKAQQAALQQAIALRQQAADKIGQVQQPYTNFGTSSVNALTNRLGLAPPPSTAAPATTANALTGAAQGMDRATPMAAGTNVAPPKTGGVIDPAPSFDGSMTAVSPNGMAPTAAAPASNALTGQPSTTPTTLPQGTDPGTYGSTANPVAPGNYSSPGNFSYGLSDYQASPAYQYQQDQARRATVAGASATGALQSGAAMKELQDRAQNIAYQDFTNERAFAAGQFNSDRNFGLTAFNTNQNVYQNNRDYLTNRFDTQTNNLFKGTAVGQQAAGVVSNADLNVANGNAQSATQIGDAQAGNALQQGNISSGVLNNVAGQVAGAFGPKSNALTPFPVQSAGGYGGNLSTSPVNGAATFVNPLPSYSY